MKKKIEKGTIIRTVILVIAIANNALALAGTSLLPISNETVTETVSFLFTTGAALLAWWRNNSFSQEAIIADEELKKLKLK